MKPASTLRVGLTQWHATEDPARNSAVAVRLIHEAAANGAELVSLPENGLMLSTGPKMRELAFTLDSPEVLAIRRAAEESGTVVVLGGMKHRNGELVSNSAVVIGADGSVLGTYEKIHLFDARVNGQSFEASKVERSGDQPVIIEFRGWRLGLTICYDVRFPDLYRTLANAGVDALLVPSAFTRITGQAHWEPLLRARAIENGCFVVASATVTPAGVTTDAFETYGHAMVVDPWGTVLADLEETPEAVSVVELPHELIEKARTALPVLHQQRPDAYERTPRLITAHEGEMP